MKELLLLTSFVPNPQTGDYIMRYVGIGVVALVIVGFGIFLLFGGKKNKDSKPKEVKKEENKQNK